LRIAWRLKALVRLCSGVSLIASDQWGSDLGIVGVGSVGVNICMGQNVKGFVYLAICPEFKSLIKIGFTTKRPEERVSELYTTSVPCPFELVAFYRCKSVEPRKLERDIHEALAKYRVSKRREFFRVDVDTARIIISKMLNSSGVRYRFRRHVKNVLKLVVAVTVMYWVYVAVLPGGIDYMRSLLAEVIQSRFTN